jgi:hypothetical protein
MRNRLVQDERAKRVWRTWFKNIAHFVKKISFETMRLFTEPSKPLGLKYGIQISILGSVTRFSSVTDPNLAPVLERTRTVGSVGAV